MGRYLLILVLFLGSVPEIIAQDNVENPFFDIYFQSKDISLDNVPYHFKTRVNLLDQFFKRFNMEMNIEGEDIYPNDIAPVLLLPKGKEYWKDIKSMMLHYITDPATYYKDSILYQNFENTIIKNDINLKFNDGMWYAIAEADAILNTKKIKSSIILEIVKDRKGYKWVVSDIIFPKGSLKGIKANKIRDYPKTDSSIFISPLDHETNFIGLNKILNSPDIISILHKKFDNTLKNKLIYLINNNKLNFNFIKNVKFAFKTVPGYVFFVKFFNRPDQNSGWLISEVKYKDKTIDK